MCQNLGIWCSDGDYSSFNLPLIQAACAFAVLEYFFGPFFSFIATILCIVVFAQYKDKTTDPTVYNVLISMSIINTVLQIVGIAMTISGGTNFCYYDPYGYGYNYYYYGYYGYGYVTLCDPGTLIAGVVIWFITMFSFGIVRAVYIFDLSNKINAYLIRPHQGTDVIVVQQDQQQPQQQTVVTTTQQVSQPYVMTQQPGVQYVMTQQQGGVYAQPQGGMMVQQQQPVQYMVPMQQ